MQKPENGVTNGETQDSLRVNALRWLRREQDLTIISLGEYCLPFFLGAMEACWINGVLIGLAGLDFLGFNAALLPFWGPPLFLLLVLWLFRRVLQKEGGAEEAGKANQGTLFMFSEMRWLVGVVGVITLFLVWLEFYSSTSSLFDPHWLQAVGGDLFALTPRFYQALILVAVVIYVCWRGMRLAQLSVEPAHVFRQLWTGLLVLLLAILLRARLAEAGKSADDIVLLLTIPVFLYLALSAHALARITFIRRGHPIGLEGSILDQERAMLGVITMVGLVLLILTLISGSFFSPAFFNALQPVWHMLSVAYSWLVNVISQGIVWLMTPFFWLFTLLFSHIPQSNLKINQQKPATPKQTHPLSLDPTTPALQFGVKIILPLLLLLLLFLLVRLALRRRRRMKIAFKRKGDDIHESVWSWALFRQQLQALWRALLQLLFPRRASETEQVRQPEEIQAVPAVRSMREIYRAFLRKAAGRGYVRGRDETPYEFQSRLSAIAPEAKPQVGLLTEAYARARYGGNVPDEGELGTIRQAWNELDQRWEIS